MLTEREKATIDDAMALLAAGDIRATRALLAAHDTRELEERVQAFITSEKTKTSEIFETLAKIMRDWLDLSSEEQDETNITIFIGDRLPDNTTAPADS